MNRGRTVRCPDNGSVRGDLLNNGVHALPESFVRGGLHSECFEPVEGQECSDYFELLEKQASHSKALTVRSFQEPIVGRRCVLGFDLCALLIPSAVESCQQNEVSSNRTFPDLFSQGHQVAVFNCIHATVGIGVLASPTGSQRRACIRIFRSYKKDFGGDSQTVRK